MNRRDGIKVKDVQGMNNILIDFKPNRCDAPVYMNRKIDVTNFCKFIDKLKKEDDFLTYYHGMVYLMGKTIYSRPLLNRFIANRTMYMHKDVSLSFTAKAEFNDESVEFLSVIKIDEEDTIFDIGKKVKAQVEKIRNHKVEDGANNAVEIVGKSPKCIRKIITGTIKWLDKHGWLPKSLIEGNLYYASAILSNIGTFKVGAIYHNLANFGTASSLITFGEIVEENGRKYMEMGATLDERIADGFYFCKALKLIEYMFDNPEVMLEPASKKVSIPKKETKSK